MERIGREYCWIIQLIAENEGHNNHVAKALWMGSKSAVEHIKYQMEEKIEVVLNPSGVSFSVEEDLSKTKFQTFVQSVPQSPYWMGGVIVPWRLRSLVYGTPENMEEKIYQILLKKLRIPILRTWMPRIVQRLRDRGDLHPLVTAGVDYNAYRFHCPSEKELEKVLLNELDYFKALADEYYKNSLVADKATA